MRDQERSLNTPKVVFEDESILILNKPAGWVVTNDKTNKAPTIQDWLGKNYDFEIYKFHECRNGIVHRLDKETSGILIVSKTKESFENIQKQFKDNRIVKKTYIALVHDKLVPAEGEIDVEIGRLPWRRDRFGVLSGGRQSKTLYKVTKYLQDLQKNSYSLVEFYPQTGRTHQIRVHSKHLHHPIVADEFYAGRKRSRADKKWCPRLFLHAYKISFKHPVTQENVNFAAELHEDLKDAMKTLTS